MVLFKKDELNIIVKKDEYFLVYLKEFKSKLKEYIKNNNIKIVTLVEINKELIKLDLKVNENEIRRKLKTIISLL